MKNRGASLLPEPLERPIKGALRMKRPMLPEPLARLTIANHIRADAEMAADHIAVHTSMYVCVYDH